MGVEIEVNANSAPNLVGVGTGAELGKINSPYNFDDASWSYIYGKN